MPVNQGIGLAQLQTLLNIAQSLDRRFNPAWLTAMRLHTQIFAHQRQSQREATNRLYQRPHFALINQLKSWHQPLQQHSPLILAQLVYPARILLSEIERDIGKAR